MKSQSAIAYIMGVVVLLLCCIGYLEFVGGLGFPDGHITDYERRMKGVFQVIVLPVLFLSLYSFYLGVCRKAENISKQLTIVAVFLLVCLGIFFLLGQFFYHHVDYGQGD